MGLEEVPEPVLQAQAAGFAESGRPKRFRSVFLKEARRSGSAKGGKWVEAELLSPRARSEERAPLKLKVKVGDYSVARSAPASRRGFETAARQPEGHAEASFYFWNSFGFGLSFKLDQSWRASALNDDFFLGL